MRCHSLAPFLVVIAAACGSLTDVPATASPDSPSLLFGSNPPPPPVDTGYIADYDGTSGSGDARFLANRPGTIVWLQFESSSSILASPNARLMYNFKSGRTNGTGKLTFPGGIVLDLSQVSIVSVAGCPPFSEPGDGGETRVCEAGFAAFTVAGGGRGFFLLGASRTETHLP